MNCYTNLGTLKSAGMLGITNANYDSELLRIAEQSSRMIDKNCDRVFYIYEGTFYQDGGASRVVLDFDVQTISSLTVDEGNNTYPNTYTVDINSPTTAPDVFTCPANKYPKTRLEANPFGSWGHLGAGFRKALKITGTFGYGNEWPNPNYHALSSLVGADLTSTATAVSVTASTASEITAGMTLKIKTEQVYVNAQPTASSCPITRAVNGTSAVTASTGNTINVYDYPPAITQACVIQTVRTWKRREAGYVNSIINTDMGNIQVYKGLDPDVAETIKEYRRLGIGGRYL